MSVPVEGDRERLTEASRALLRRPHRAWPKGDEEWAQTLTIIEAEARAIPLSERLAALHPNHLVRGCPRCDLLANGFPDGVDGDDAGPTSDPGEGGLLQPSGDLLRDGLQAGVDLVFAAGDVEDDLDVAAEGGSGCSCHADTVQPAVPNVNRADDLVNYAEDGLNGAIPW